MTPQQAGVSADELRKFAPRTVNQAQPQAVSAGALDDLITAWFDKPKVLKGHTEYDEGCAATYVCCAADLKAALKADIGGQSTDLQTDRGVPSQDTPRFHLWEEVYKLHQKEGILMGEALKRVVAAHDQKLRELVAVWMIANSFATGHGDTVEDLLKELKWQIKEHDQKVRAEVCEEIFNLIPASKCIDDNSAQFREGFRSGLEAYRQAIRSLASGAEEKKPFEGAGSPLSEDLR